MYYRIILEVAVFLVLGICTMTDWFYRKVWLPVPLLTVPVILFCIAGMKGEMGSHILCGIISGAGFLGVSVVSGGQIEKGDGVILGIMGLALGVWKSMVFLFFSFSYAFIAAIFLVVVRKKKRSYRMPFVLFMLLGYVTLLVVGGMV